MGERLDYGNNTLYYLPSVTEQEAQNLFDYLIQEEIFDGDNDVDFQLRKEGGVYEARMNMMRGVDLTDMSDDLTFVACLIQDGLFTGSTLHLIIVGDMAVDTFDEISGRYPCS